MDLLETLTQNHGLWQSLQPLTSEDRERLWKKLRLEWNYHSNHIEGNTLTYRETELLLIHDQTSGCHHLRDYIEMKAHDVAIDHVEKLVDETRPLSEADIRDFNKILLKEPFVKAAETPDGLRTQIKIFPGEYKTQPNNVRTQSGGMFEFASPAEVPAKMNALIDWYREASQDPEQHPMEVAAKLHHDFVLIHPFGDGNGRTARILVNFALMRCGYPPLIVPSEKKDEYLNALRFADNGDLNPLTTFLGQCALAALDPGIRAARGESIEESDDLAKEIDLFKRGQRIQAEETEPKSKKSLQDVFDHTIRPLFREFIAEHRRLDDMFNDVVISANGVPINSVEEWETRAEKYIIERPNSLNSFTISYKLNGFTGASATPFSLQTAITASFLTFDYSVKIFGGNEFPRKRYLQPITESERLDMIKRSLNLLFSQIQAKSGQI